jgi:chromosome segregation ATPase
MQRIFPHWVALIIAVALLFVGSGTFTSPASADPAGSVNNAGKAPEDVFKDKGLTKVGFLLETAQEAELHTAANTIRGLRTKLTSEALERTSMTRAVQTASDVVDQLNSQLVNLDEQMTKVKKDPAKYNQLVEPFNATLKELKLRRQRLMP